VKAFVKTHKSECGRWLRSNVESFDYKTWSSTS